MEVTATLIKDLRERTGAGMADCKKALQEAEADMEKAIDYLRKKGLAKAAKKAGREATEGAVVSYIHGGGRIGVLVEINCETDFVARNDDFAAFTRDIASHIAASAPRYVTEDEVPQADRDAEQKVFQEQAAEEGKPPPVQEKIAEGRMKKWLEEVVLLNQTHVNADKHDGKTIEELRAAISATTGENVVIRRFARFAIGD